MVNAHAFLAIFEKLDFLARKWPPKRDFHAKMAYNVAPPYLTPLGLSGTPLQVN